MQKKFWRCQYGAFCRIKLHFYNFYDIIKISMKFQYWTNQTYYSSSYLEMNQPVFYKTICFNLLLWHLSSTVTIYSFDDEAGWHLMSNISWSNGFSRWRWRTSFICWIRVWSESFPVMALYFFKGKVIFAYLLSLAVTHIWQFLCHSVC